MEDFFTREGVIEKILYKSGTTQNGEWKAVDFILSWSSTYKDKEGNEQVRVRKIMPTLFGAENVDKFSFLEGDKVVVKFSTDVNEYNGRFFNRINAFSVEPASGQQPQQPTMQVDQQPQVQQPIQPSNDNNGRFGYAPNPNNPYSGLEKPRQEPQSIPGESLLPF